LAKLGAEIRHKGLCEPIIVRRKGNDGYEIVDGEHRWRICRDSGWEEVPCIIQDFDDNEAKIKTLQLNYMRGSVLPLKLASLIHDLNKEMKLEDLAKRLPYEEALLKDNLELLKLPDDFGKTIEEQAKQEEEELPSVISFVVYKKQLEAIEQALEMSMNGLPEGTKNSKAIALEMICLDFLAKQEVKNDSVSPS
jgi:ParB family chromosome partitioning protein